MNTPKSSQSTPRRNATHYSYALYEKDEVTRGFDKARFSGEIGQFFKKHQESLIFKYLGDPAKQHVLDLGAGTGRTSLPLSHAGARVTAADASIKMLEIIREKSFLQGTPVALSRIDAHNLPFHDRAFSAAMSFRMLMHVTHWKQALSELCRVSDDLVIVDFPPRCGFAGLAPVVHPLIRPFNSNHQSYRVFNTPEISDALHENGFEVIEIDKHVVLPFGLHRAINSIKFTKTTENILAKIGIRALFGAPVTVIARRNR